MADYEDDGPIIPLDEARRRAQSAGQAPVDPNSREGRRQSRNALLGANNADEYKPRAIPGITAADLGQRPLVAPSWWLDGMIYERAVGCLYAPGGTGKSYVALQMAVASALGEDFCGLPTTSGRTIIWSCEDGIDVLHSRLDRIVRARGRTMADLEDRIVVFDRTEQDNTMLRVDKSFDLVGTRLWDDFLLTTERLEPALTIVDGLWNIYDGPENNRGMAYKVVTKLKEIVQVASTTVLMTAHPSLSGMTSGEGTSGSTAWNGAWRFRLLLERPERKGIERVLKTMKQNYGSDDGEIRLLWDDEAKVYVHDQEESGTIGALKREAERNRFVETLWRVLRAGRRVTTGSKSSPNHVTKVFGIEKDWRGWSASKLEKLAQDCWDHELVRMGQVRDHRRRHIEDSLVPHNWDDSGA
jgi:RecA-family ATPase